jgi:hypothetical protein
MLTKQNEGSERPQILDRAERSPAEDREKIKNIERM